MGEAEWAAAEKKAQGQRGVITLQELETIGLKSSAILWAATSGRLVRMFNRAYRFSAVTPSWEQAALAATMLAGEGSALAHATAATLWGLPGFEATTQPIHLSVPGRKSRQLSARVVVHRPRVSFEVYRLRGLPVTRLARTIVDIAHSVTDERLEIVLDAAQHRYRALPRWLNEEVTRHSPQSQPGLSRLLELIALRGGVATESPLETRVRRAIRAHGLLPPRPQVDIFDDDRRFVMRADFAWEEHQVALHVDGFAWHAVRTAFDRDAAQRSRLASIDWMSFTVTHATLQDGAWLSQLALTLQHRNPQKELFRLPGGTAPRGRRT